MNRIIKSLATRITLFSVLGVLLLFIGVPSGLYGLTLQGGASLGGALILMAVFVVFIILLIDRLLAQKIKPKKLSLLEASVLILLVGIYSFRVRAITIDMKDNQADYFVLIENNGEFVNSEMSYSFPFNKKMVVNDKNAVIGSISGNFNQLDFNAPRNWNSSIIRPWNIKGYKVRFYSNGDLKLSNSKIDSLILKEVKSVLTVCNKL